MSVAVGWALPTKTEAQPFPVGDAHPTNLKSPFGKGGCRGIFSGLSPKSRLTR
jgi:hypothetical protein